MPEACRTPFKQQVIFFFKASIWLKPISLKDKCFRMHQALFKATSVCFADGQIQFLARSKKRQLLLLFFNSSFNLQMILLNLKSGVKIIKVWVLKKKVWHRLQRNSCLTRFRDGLKFSLINAIDRRVTFISWITQEVQMIWTNGDASIQFFCIALVTVWGLDGGDTGNSYFQYRSHHLLFPWPAVASATCLIPT